MDDLEPLLKDAFHTCGFVSSHQLQRALRISRQAVWNRLRPLVESGELRVVGVGRGARYRPGSGFDGQTGALRGEGPGALFWNELAREAPRFAYVSILGATTRGTTRAQHAHAILRPLRGDALVVLDFLGVLSVSPRFLRALLHGPYSHSGRILMPINACEHIRRLIERERRIEARRLTNPLLD
jgi:hypothetical protein